MRSNPPPRLIPDEYGKPFMVSLIDSVYALWFNSDKLTSTLESELLNTTDATVTTLNLIPLDDETTYQINTKVLAVESGGADRASYEIIGTFYRSGGVATQQGATTVLHNIESDASWSVIYDVSANDVRIRVSGAAAWRCSSKVIGLSN